MRLLLAVLVLAAGTPASLPDIEDEVMCVQCGTALNVSESAVAERERDYIRRLIAQGKTKEEVKAALVDEYGEDVLALPRREGFGLAAYVVPPLLALLAVLALFTTVRRWRRAGATRAAAAGPALSDEDARRLDRDMAGYDV